MEDRLQPAISLDEVVARAEIPEDIASGVVSVPHGWDHCDPNAMLWIAHAYGGVNVNILSDDLAHDVPSGGLLQRYAGGGGGRAK